jgi:hypothetical protein
MLIGSLVDILIERSNIAVKRLAFVLPILEMLVQISARCQTILTEVFRRFSQSLQESHRIKPQIIHDDDFRIFLMILS